MIAYKGMCPGMVCLGYQLKMGLNVTEEANCQANGFHCAANPMDCLRYYGDFRTRNTIWCDRAAIWTKTQLILKFPAHSSGFFESWNRRSFFCMRLRIWQTIRRCRMAVMSKENVRRHGMATPSCAASTRAQRASSEIFWHLPEKL